MHSRARCDTKSLRREAFMQSACLTHTCQKKLGSVWRLSEKCAIPGPYTHGASTRSNSTFNLIIMFNSHPSSWVRIIRDPTRSEKCNHRHCNATCKNARSLFVNSCLRDFDNLYNARKSA